jgi:hypothetical protein
MEAPKNSKENVVGPASHNETLEEWIEPEFSILKAGSTSGGIKPNTVEAFYYHPS